MSFSFCSSFKNNFLISVILFQLVNCSKFLVQEKREFSDNLSFFERVNLVYILTCVCCIYCEMDGKSLSCNPETNY